MEKVAVLTGDVIDSTKLSVSEREKFDKLLHQGLTEIAGKNNFEIFRGDSFQVLLTNPDQALKTAIQLRCWLRKQHIYEQSQIGNSKGKIKAKAQPITSSYKKGIIDARLSIGIGSVSYKSKNIKTSDGEAFQLSGRALDNPKNKNARIMIATPDAALNDHLEVT